MKRDYLNTPSPPAISSIHYERSRLFKIKSYSTAAGRMTLVTPDYLAVVVDNRFYYISSEVEIDLSVASNWDTQTPTDCTVAANRAGKDFYLYACQSSSGSAPTFKLSAASTYPSGYTASNSRKIVTFHCECVNVGTISGHPLTGFLAGDIVPRSIQDLKHRPKPGFIPGMVWCGATDFDTLNGVPIWKAIYLASGTGANTASAYGATITDARTWYNFAEDFAAIGCRMLSFYEFMITSEGCPQQVNIYGSADPVTTGGHVATNSVRMISYYGSEDDCGVVWQWAKDHIYRLPDSGAIETCEAWGWINQGNSKGSAYLQNSGYAEAMFIAGGYWSAGSNCGSRSRDADTRRTVANSIIGCRFVAEPA